LTDLASPGVHPLAKHAKDVAAGAVLLAAAGASLVGVIVFAPHASALLLD
jgi:diacylglycerol kinase